MGRKRSSYVDKETEKVQRVQWPESRRVCDECERSEKVGVVPVTWPCGWSPVNHALMQALPT